MASLWDLSPWQQLPYCTAIKTSSLTGPVTGTQIVQANNQRCGLLIAATSASAVVISLTPTTVNGFGITISPQPAYIYFNSRDTPVFCTAAWFCLSGGIAWNIYELIAQDWPEDGDHYLDNINHPVPPPSPTVLPTAPGVGGQQGVISYWKNLLSRLKGG